MNICKECKNTVDSYTEVIADLRGKLATTRIRETEWTARHAKAERQLAALQLKHDGLVEYVRELRKHLEKKSAASMSSVDVDSEQMIWSLDAILEEHANVDSTADDAVAEPPVRPEPGPDSQTGDDAPGGCVLVRPSHTGDVRLPR